ncbi:hypothetical protein ACFSJU_04465 [Paradesertivirga mongoliensis]|uniref:Uncharacterized protein n=1 Tax=Paradesertivirga mongoliensis TaxID=2100740 RepID=A0ABW4ZIC9_9SPHI|nr:hypothetical protein [Pedobacter mongoliensis]
MKKKRKSNAKFYGVVILFAFVVSIVEIIKTIESSKTYSQVFEQNQDSGALIVLPIFSIAIVLLLAIPRKNL